MAPCLAFVLGLFFVHQCRVAVYRVDRGGMCGWGGLWMLKCSLPVETDVSRGHGTAIA